ncbi:sulfotransferase family 2 domain-containing protein [Hyphococcus sp.]|uniref:sulfotransferase family 2 domain-containing protein n=1 Tax=Hyphococcus sp. TaxID=2038636 RepID=UPI0035C6F0A3
MGRARDILESGLYVAGAYRSAFDKGWAEKCGAMSPYQPWNREKKAIFIHVPKAAGRSVKKSLGLVDHESLGHCPAVGFQAADREFFSSSYRFAIVRDPLDRLQSAFRYLKTTTPYVHDKAWAQRHLANIPSFEVFVEKLKSFTFRAAIMPWIHFRPQAHFIADADGALLVDEIIKQETLSCSFPTLCSKLNVDTDLVHINSSATSVDNIALPRSALDVVADLYRDDYRLLDYEAR